MATTLVSLLSGARGAQRPGDDGRDHAARAGVAGRWHQREGAGCQPGRLDDRSSCPERNRKDLDDIPEAVRQKMNFIFAERVDQVVEAALTPPLPVDVPDTAERPGPAEEKPELVGA